MPTGARPSQGILLLFCLPVLSHQMVAFASQGTGRHGLGQHDGSVPSRPPSNRAFPTRPENHTATQANGDATKPIVKW
jgi:hypothetical protein